MRRPFAIAISLALAATAFAARGRADANEDKAAAQVLFDEGKRLAKADNYTEACPKFEESQRLDPAIGTQFKLADCFEHVGRTASAWGNYLEAGAAAAKLGQNDRVAIARQRAEALAPKLTKLLITVEGQVPSGFQLTRDGAPVGSGLWGTAVPLDPGPHELRATAPGRAPWHTTVDVRGAGVTVTAVVPPLAPAASWSEAAPPASAPPTNGHAGPVATDHGGLGTQRTVGLAIGAAGIVGIGAGSILGLLASGKNSDALKHCEKNPPPNAPRPCTQLGLDLTSSARGLAAGSTVAFVLGTAAVAGGAVLYFTAPHAQSSTALRVSPTGAWIDGQF